MHKWTLDIIGYGSLENDLKKIIEENNLKSNIKFHGFKDWEHITQLYCEFDIFILPTLRDPSPLGIVTK